jgi:hypothetical protein
MWAIALAAQSVKKNYAHSSKYAILAKPAIVIG